MWPGRIRTAARDAEDQANPGAPSSADTISPYLSETLSPCVNDEEQEEKEEVQQNARRRRPTWPGSAEEMDAISPSAAAAAEAGMASQASLVAATEAPEHRIVSAGGSGGGRARRASLTSGKEAEQTDSVRREIVERAAGLEAQKDLLEAVLDESERQLESGMKVVKLMLAQLDTGRAASQDTVRVLKETAAAEAAYGKALRKIGNRRLGTGDGVTLKLACEAADSYPGELARAHDDCSDTILREVDRLNSMVAELKEEESSIAVEAARMQRDMEAARTKLRSAFHDYERACSLQHFRRGDPAQEDPWLAECALLEAHSTMRSEGDTYRGKLTNFFENVKLVDGKRVDVLKSVLTTYVLTFQTLLGRVQKSVDQLTSVVVAVDPAADVAAFQKATKFGPSETPLNSQPSSPRSAAARISADLLSPVSYDDLLQSKEITKQGPILRLGQVTGQWKDSLLVLTRSGFLHWFYDKDQILVPMDGVRLCLCTVEIATPPQFVITETEKVGRLSILVRPKHRSFSFKAMNKEECMAWVLAIKEAIMEASLEQALVLA